VNNSLDRSDCVAFGGVMLGALLLVVLSGCATDAYYTAMAARFDAEKSRYEADMAARAKEEATPLVNFSWTDEYGIDRALVVNRPSMAYRDPVPAPQFHMPAPWEGAYQFFDRGLSTTERLLPFVLSPREQNDSTSTKTSYVFGDGAHFQQSRDYSPQGITRDNAVYGPSPLAIE
jgi:hypothetical protein